MTSVADIDAEVRKMHVQDGDVIVLTVAERLSPDQEARAKAYVDAVIERLGVQATGLVLSGGASILVLRKDEARETKRRRC